MAYLVKIDTAAQFTADNAVLLPNQIGQESDTELTKRGDGQTAWNSLYYDTPVTGCFEQTLSAFKYRVPSSYAVTQAIAAAGAALTLSQVLTNGNDGGSLDIKNVFWLRDSSNLKSVTIEDRYLTDISENEVLNWNDRKLFIGQWDYDADYSGSYTARSLVDKAYADSVASPLTATYVGFGSGANVLTGSANLVWNGTTLSVGGYDAMTVNGAAVTAMLAIHSDTLSVYESHTHSNTVAAGATYYGARSRGTSAIPLVVQNGDYLVWNAAVGYDGTDYALGGYSAFIVDGTPGANDMPTKWILAVSADGSQTPTAALTISSTTAATFASTVSSTGYKISGAATSGTILRGDGTNYVASTATYPNTIGAGQLLYATSANTVGGNTDFLRLSTGELLVGYSTLASGEYAGIQKNQNGATYFSVTNSTSGTASSSLLVASSSSSIATSIQMGTYSAGYTSSGIAVANAGVIRSNNSAGFNAGTTTATQFSFWTNNAERARFLSTGELVINNTAITLNEKFHVTQAQIGSASNSAAYINVTTSGTATGGYFNGLYVNMAAGYTGSVFTNAMVFDNQIAGTNSSYSSDVATYSYRLAGNRGVGGYARAVTTGHNVGGLYLAGGGAVNYGLWAAATLTKNSATNVGVFGSGLNGGTSPIQVGGYFTLYNAAAAPPINESAALIADNGSQTSPIFLARDNGTAKFKVLNGGSVVCSDAALATNATDGFLYIPTCAGTPTGVPTAQTGTVAMIFDTTNKKLYIYSGSWIGGTVPGVFS